jgi:hypothetical protein
MFLPLREINIDGMLVDPAAVMLVACAVLFFPIRMVMNYFLDLNRFVWRRPVVDITLLILLYCAAILTFRPL